MQQTMKVKQEFTSINMAAAASYASGHQFYTSFVAKLIKILGL